MRLLAIILSLMCSACFAGGESESNARATRDVRVALNQRTVVHSSVLTFEFEGTEHDAASFAVVEFEGTAGTGVLQESYVVGVERLESGNLGVRLRVFDGLWSAVDPAEDTTFTGLIVLELHDAIGLFARGEVGDSQLTFMQEIVPRVDALGNGMRLFPDERVPVTATGILRPEEGTTWVVVERGTIVYPDGARLPIANAKTELVWTGTRDAGAVRIHPKLFGVRSGSFSGDIRFENELKTGEVFEGSSQSFECEIRVPEISDYAPSSGSRGQKITLNGNGFLASEKGESFGTFLVFEGTFSPDNPALPPTEVVGANAFVRVPYRVVDDRLIEQDVWYDIDPQTRRLTGLGSVPGLFDGTVRPVIFNGTDEQPGIAVPLKFRVLSTTQVLYLKYLPGFLRALELYGLREVESAIRDRIVAVLARDYDGVNVDIRTEEPDDFVEFTTIEIGGTDPSGLLNFGYDNSFNDGGKDIGNLYLSDYLGGVNRHSLEAGYLPYGGVFIESFIAFSPSLYPDNFGTSVEFDKNLAPFMIALGGTPVTESEFPGGPRDAAIRNAIDLIGSLTGHTASHELGHALGLTHYPEHIEDHDERFHNDPAGDNWIMDSGSERPFEERAELNGKGPAVFSPSNRTYLRDILPMR